MDNTLVSWCAMGSGVAWNSKWSDGGGGGVLSRRRQGSAGRFFNKNYAF